jgi:hypothetical protein
VKAALTGQILIRKGKIWTARLRIGRVVIFQASAPRIFNAAALVAVDLVAVIASAAAAGLAAVIVSVAADLGVIALEVAASVAVVALVDSAAAAGSGADAEN